MTPGIRRAVGWAFVTASLLGICGTWTGMASAAAVRGASPARPAATQIFDGYGNTSTQAYDAALSRAEAAGYTQSECSAVYQFISHHPLILEAILTCTN